MDLMDKDLSLNYLSHCDPRLNYEQSLGTSIPAPSSTLLATPHERLTILLVVYRCRFPYFRLLEGKAKRYGAKGCFVGGIGEREVEFDGVAVDRARNTAEKMSKVAGVR
jgi:hypothetical protein